jgi:soluble lytic murein transglycosylase-like protein
MVRVSLLPALLLGATLAAASPAAAGPLNNKAWWTTALQGVQGQPSTAVSALPAAVSPGIGPSMLPSASLVQPFVKPPMNQALGGQTPGAKGVDVGYDLCLGPIYRAEREKGIPTHLLRSIALAESGRWDDASSRTVAWPWTVNAEGVGHFFPSKQAAIAFVHKLRAKGVKSMDVGCMQVNLHWHAEAFASLEEAFEPEKNVAYAARHLTDLKNDRKGWTEAVGYYHSATPEHNQRYRAKVLKLWADVQRKPEATQLAAAAANVAPGALAGAGRQMPMGFAQPASGFTSPAWINRDARAVGAAKVTAVSSSAGSVSTGRRGMGIQQYMMAPTMQALDMPKGAPVLQ